jgi:hypothetical protein
MSRKRHLNTFVDINGDGVRSSMSLEFQKTAGAPHVLTVYDATDFRCILGVNRGDALEISDTLCMGDTYRLEMNADALHVELIGPDPANAERGGYRLASTPEVPAELGPSLTMMTEAGGLTKMRSLFIGEHCFLLPLGAVDLFAPHTIIDQAPDIAPLPLADPTCLAFSRGTHIATQDGRLVPIEDLNKGDMLLTRSGRAVPVRAILSETVPAVGRATRVVIREGAFSNEAELVVAADHRLFVPARRRELDPTGADRMEAAIKLINGLTVTAYAGGRNEYFHVLLDQHEVIYAEGIPCESFLLTDTTHAGLSDDLALQLTQSGFTARHTPHPAALPLALRPSAKTQATEASLRVASAV